MVPYEKSGAKRNNRLVQFSVYKLYKYIIIYIQKQTNQLKLSRHA
jgi:hypothetical protein